MMNNKETKCNRTEKGAIMPFCKQVLAKVILVPCSVY